MTQPAIDSTSLLSKTDGSSSRVFSSVGLAILSQIVSAATAILLVPLFIRAWGADGYGQWIALTAFIAYLSLLDLGGQSFIGNLLARDYVQNNQASFRRHLTEGVSLFSFIALAVFFLLVVVLSQPNQPFPGESLPMSADERLVLLFMGASLLLSIPQGVFVSVYRATGHLSLGMALGLGMRFLLLVSYVCMLLAGFPPVAYAVGYFVGIAVLSIVAIGYAIYGIPWCRGVPISWRAAWAGRVYLSGSLFFWLFTVSAALNQQGVILVLNANAAATMVALYATHRTAAGLLGYASSLFMGPVWSEMSLLSGGEQHEKLSRLALMSIRVVVFLSVSAAIVLWLALPVIYPLWTDQQISLNSQLLLIFLIQGVLAAGWTTSGWSLLASNQHRRLSVWALSNAVLTIVLAIVLVQRWGVVGVAIASLTGDLVCGLLVYPRLAAPQLGVSVSEVYRSILRPMGVMLVLSGLLFGIVLLTPGVGGMLASSFVLVILLYPAMRLSLGKSETAWLMEQLKSFVRRKPQVSYS